MLLEATCTVYVFHSHIKESKEELTEHVGRLWELLTHIVWNTNHWLISDTMFIFPTHWTKTRVFILSARLCT
jgi:hypothetical protein